MECLYIKVKRVWQGNAMKPKKTQGNKEMVLNDCACVVLLCDEEKKG